MEDQSAIQSSNYTEQQLFEDKGSGSTSVADTAIKECLDIVRGEYEIERQKKASFETRAGAVGALAGSISLFFLNNINLQYIFSLFNVSLTMIELIKIISGLVVYGSFVWTMFKVVETVNVKLHTNFNVEKIDDELLSEEKREALTKIITTYKEIIINHRNLNEKRATNLKRSLYGICVMIISVIVYINLK